MVIENIVFAKIIGMENLREQVMVNQFMYTAGCRTEQAVHFLQAAKWHFEVRFFYQVMPANQHKTIDVCWNYFILLFHRVRWVCFFKNLQCKLAVIAADHLIADFRWLLFFFTLNYWQKWYRMQWNLRTC